MKIAELKQLTTQELQERLATEEQNLAKLKLTHSVSPLDNPMQIRAARKDIARIYTEMRLREIKK